jgi:hypothetical protein
MPRLPNPLVYDLIELAETLATQRGRPNIRKAALRRAVSSAYYGTFHALCFVCASEFVGWSRSELLEPVYRMLDHGTAKRRLSGREGAALGEEIAEIGALFADLQDARHAADYAPPTLAVHPADALRQIAAARRIVELIECLAADSRKRLAILLVTKGRQA